MNPLVPRRVAVALGATLLVAVACSREPDAAPGTETASGALRFAFVTDNSSEFWTIAEKGCARRRRISASR